MDRHATLAMTNQNKGSQHPARLAFVQKGRQTILCFGGGAQPGNALGGVFHHSIVDRLVVHRADQIFGGCLRQRPPLDQRVDDLLHLGVQQLGLHRLMHQAQLTRTHSVDALGRLEVAVTLARTDGPHHIGADGGGDDAALTGLPWVSPSPNMPTIDTAFIYPGTCLIEGTNLSEGRGTTKPFELIGAPFVDAHGLADRLNRRNFPGAHFRPAWFTPSFSKFQGQMCAGVQIHITDRTALAPVDTGIAVLLEVARHHSKDFSFLPGNPPFFDKLAGVSWLRDAIVAGESLDGIKTRWQAELSAFKLKRARRLLY